MYCIFTDFYSYHFALIKTESEDHLSRLIFWLNSSEHNTKRKTGTERENDNLSHKWVYTNLSTDNTLNIVSSPS